MMFSEDFEMSDVRPGCSYELETDDRLVLHRHDHLQGPERPGASVNVTDCANVHVGPSIISITQNVENVEVPKGKVLGLELISLKNGKRLRCNIFVCVSWTLVAASLFVFLVLFFTLPTKPPKRMVLDLKEPWYINRNKWNADIERDATLLKLPVKKVLIGHSGEVEDFCEHIDDCIQIVLAIQNDHKNKLRWADIGPNFLVGGNGLIFEGRGANFQGAMVEYFNNIIISVMFLGNYVKNESCEEQFRNTNVLLEELVKKRVLAKDFEVFGQCQVKKNVVPPGPGVMDKMDRFPQWNPVNNGTCLRTDVRSNVTDDSLA